MIAMLLFSKGCMGDAFLVFVLSYLNLFLMLVDKHNTST